MYIDPNAGGMLFQVLATSLALFSGLILLFSGKIRAFVARFRRSIRGDSDGNEVGMVEDQPSTSEDSDPQD